jgi:hypothetical protein
MPTADQEVMTVVAVVAVGAAHISQTNVIMSMVPCLTLG